MEKQVDGTNGQPNPADYDEFRDYLEALWPTTSGATYIGGKWVQHMYERWVDAAPETRLYAPADVADAYPNGWGNEAHRQLQDERKQDDRRWELLRKYASRKPRAFRQFDGWYLADCGDSFMVPDEDGDWLSGSWEDELMYGPEGVRVLIPEGTEKADVVRLLRKITDWVEGDLDGDFFGRRRSPCLVNGRPFDGDPLDGDEIPF
jgi:hypothetical protein